MNNIDAKKIKSFLVRNNVTLLFAVLVSIMLWITTFSPALILEEIVMRMGRSMLLVLALLFPIIAGIGLNFGIVIGAIAAQMGMFFVVYHELGDLLNSEWSGLLGFFIAFLIATPLAILFGYLIGKMFNSMKGTEMIGGLVGGFFSDGLYQFLFLFVIGGLIPFAPHPLIIPTGVGVVIQVNLRGNLGMVLDQTVHMNMLLDIVFYAAIAIAIALLIYRVIKKRDLGLPKMLKIMIPLAVIWGLSFIPAVNTFLSEPRLRMLYAVQYGAILAVLLTLWKIVKGAIFEKKVNVTMRRVAVIVISIILFALTFVEAVSGPLTRVQLPVLTLTLTVLICLFIRWFLNTKLGQDMRTVGQDKAVATSSGINVNRVRIIATVMSTTLAAWGQMIFLQNMGTMAMFGAHPSVGLYSIAALLVGGASVQTARIKHAILGMFLFHTLLFLAPNVGAELTGNSMYGEYFRLFATNGVVAVALVMHALSRRKGATLGQPLSAPKEAKAK